VSDDAPRPVGRFDLPTELPTPRGTEESETVRDRPSDARSAEPQRAVSVFDPPRVRFDEQAELGRGGMGRVVEAIDLALDRPVAIKHLLATGDAELARFEREVRITARLQHPSIVPILDAGRDAQGRPFYIMRKIDGEPLSARVAAATTVRDRIALVPAMLGAIDAAAYAHAQGVIHRDIKPWNILLGPFGETLLIDWGIARDLTATETHAPRDQPAQRDSGLTRVGDAVGTPGFMSPEQARGEPVDRRADVYSLGATLYFVLTGELPFAGSSATMAISNVAAGGGPDLSKIPPEVPAELGAIVVKALATDRDARYGDASELATDLRRFLAGQLVAAHHYTTGERWVRWIRKHRLVAAITLVAVVAMTATAIVAFRSVVDQRDQARSARELAEARAEELLVDRARSMVSVDPTSAVALLRRLPPQSRLWAQAREIVRAAVPAGVERGLNNELGHIYALAISSGGQLAVAGTHTIELHDLARRTRRVLAKHSAHDLVWRDAKTLVYSANRSDAPIAALGVIDVESGTEQALPAHDLHELATMNGAILIHNADGSIDLYDAALKRARVVEEGTFDLEVQGTHALVTARDALIVLQSGGGQRRRQITLPRPPMAVRMSPSGSRVATLFANEIVEWEIDGDAPPRRWKRSGKDTQGLAYVGETLYAWDDTGGGLVSLEGEVPITRWPYHGTTLPAAAFDDGIVLATDGGRLAYVDALGVVEIPHRRLQLVGIEIAKDGRNLVIAAASGELMTIDLRVVRPSLVPVAATTSLYGVTADQIVIGDATVDPMGSTSTTRLAIVNLTSRKRIELGDVGFAPYVTLLDERVVVGAGPGAAGRVLLVWELDGRERLRAPYTNIISVGPGLHAPTSVVYGAPTGDIVEQPLEPFGPSQILRVADGKRVWRLNLTPQGIAISTLDGSVEPIRNSIEWLERGPRKAPALQYETSAFSPGFGPDGSWWIVEDLERVTRVTPDGTRTAVPLPQPIRVMTIRGDRIWALGASALYELAPDGAVLRTVSLPNGKKRGQLRDGVVSLADDGLWVTMPEANVSRLLPLPGGADQQVATRDGRFVAALTQTTPPHVAIWRDPVPIDPSAVPAYIEELTNARLDLASSAVTWDRPSP